MFTNTFTYLQLKILFIFEMVQTYLILSLLFYLFFSKSVKLDLNGSNGRNTTVNRKTKVYSQRSKYLVVFFPLDNVMDLAVNHRHRGELSKCSAGGRFALLPSRRRVTGPLCWNIEHRTVETYKLFTLYIMFPKVH